MMALLKRRIATVRAIDDRGVALIEFALYIPGLIVIGLGGVELVNYAITHARVSQVALAVADSASRTFAGSNVAAPPMREADVNDVFIGSKLQAGNLNFPLNGKIILSSLERNAANRQFIHWQRCYGALGRVSSYGRQGDVLSDGMGPASGKINAPDGPIETSGVMFVEVFYAYQPITIPWAVNWLNDGMKTLHYTAAFSVRDARALNPDPNKWPNGLINLNPAVTVSSC